MSLLKDDLLGLKNKLENIEKEFENKLRNVEGRGDKFKQMDEQINELINTKDSVIKLNIGGKIFQTKISTLLSVKDTLFYKILYSELEEKKEINKELFFDRSYTYFPFILDYLRTKKYCLKGLSKYSLDDLKQEIEYYCFSEILSFIDEMQKEIEFVNFEGASRYSSAGTHLVQDLNDKSMMKGICVQSPYHIIIELNYEHEIEAMEIGGWGGNTSIWYPGNGSNSRVLTSVDKNTWIDVGAIPSTYTNSIQKVPLTPSIAKYIKFQHNTYLGIGYLHLIRKI